MCTMPDYLIPALEEADQIGVMGDQHGDLGHSYRVVEQFAARGVRCLVVLGDFGYLWRGPHNWQRDVDKLSRKLAAGNQVLYFVDGNHEDFNILYGFPIDPDGLRRIRPNIIHIPRGWRTRIGGKHNLAALGGANSIDYEHRKTGVDWWPDEEQITPDDLRALGPAPTDVLIGHEAPIAVPTLDSHLESLPRWPAEAEAYAKQSRTAFHRAVIQTRPRLTLGGHYHHHVDESVTYDGGQEVSEAFRCRVVLLDLNGPGISQAILTTRTLELQFFYRNGTDAYPLRSAGQ